jgi:3-dehydroquinate dehydratase/shikimate dehydrogenase
MKICVSIIEPALEAAVSAAKRAEERGADLIEVRFDLMSSLPSDLGPFEAVRIPKIATLRPAAQGGAYAGNEQTRRTFLRAAARHGFGLVDLEDGSSLLREARKVLPNSRIIASYHDFESTPASKEIAATLGRETEWADVAKVAYKTNSVTDLLSLAEAAKAVPVSEGDRVIIGMGAAGEITRACADRLGCEFTYACLEAGKEAAPGQLDLETMKRLRGRRTTAGVVGASLRHSRSAAMHNAAFAALGIPGRYFKLETRKDELTKLKPIALAYGLRGFNVTIPYKEEIMPLLDSLDEVAERVKAVNTVVIEEGMLIGTNTDAFGVRRTIELAGVEAHGKRALLVGAGGAARACAAALSELGASVSITNRTASKARRLADEFDGESLPMKEAVKREFDIVINCTPLGMVGFPDELPIAPSVFREGQFVMDVIYNPPRTRFLSEAERKGAVTRNGQEMLVHQAARAFELWTGKWPPTDVMTEALRRSLG